MNLTKLAALLTVSVAVVGLVEARPASAQEAQVAGAAAFSIDQTGVVRGVATAAASGPNAAAQAAYAAGNSRAQAYFDASPVAWTAPEAGETYTEGEATGGATNIFSLAGLLEVTTGEPETDDDILTVGGEETLSVVVEGGGQVVVSPDSEFGFLDVEATEFGGPVFIEALEAF